MGLLSKLKSVLGIGDTDRRTTRDTAVPVEREPEMESEPASDRTAPEERTASRRGTTSGPERTETTAGSAAMSADSTEPDGISAAATPEETEPSGDPVDSIKGIGPAYSNQLGDAGIRTTTELAAADAGELADETGIPESRIQEWIDRARAR